MTTLSDRVKETIRDVPDFPKPGIVFKDITPVLADASLFKDIVGDFAARFIDRGVDVVVGMESRGFLFGVPLALDLDAAFVPARKPGKLPYKSVGVDYDLEYGKARLELHIDSIAAGQRVLIVDDLLATGGTAQATVDLVARLGGEVVACVFCVELDFLDGRNRLTGHEVYSLVHY